MQLIPQPWFLIPDDGTVLGADGRQVTAAEHGRPADLSTMALRCVFTDDELLARALVVLVTAGLAPQIIPDSLTSNSDPM